MSKYELWLSNVAVLIVAISILIGSILQASWVSSLGLVIALVSTSIAKVYESRLTTWVKKHN
jgi:hypothetical protein